METTISVEELMKLKSPIEERSFISLYMPPVPVKAIINQLNQEINQTEKSTNWKIKGAVIMMLKQIVNYLKLINGQIKEPGAILFAVPVSHKEALIHTILAKIKTVEVFLYVLDYQFYFNKEYFGE